MTIILRFVTCCVFALLLSGCGFHLRSQTALPPQLKRIYLQSATPFSLLTLQFQQTLKRMGVTIVQQPQSAPITLQLMADNFSQLITGTSTTNQLTSYTLTYTVSYQLLDPQGNALIEPQHISVNRNFTANNNQMLGSTNEQALLQQEMRREATLQIMNQLSAQKIIRAITQPSANADQ